MGELLLCYHRIKKVKLPFEYNEISDGGNTSLLELSFEELGLRDDNGALKKETIIKGTPYSNLANMNDNGISWPEIAKYVEKHPKNVFTKSI